MESFTCRAYLDNSATTRPCIEAVDATVNAMTVLWGNPSSLHGNGLEAQTLLDSCRDRVAAKFHCKSDEIFFTSGGTESNNTAIFGAAKALRRQGNRIVTTAVEHPSVAQAMNHLETEGFEVIRLGVNAYGRIDERELASAVNSSTVLVSIMAVNNETGTLQPVEAARRAVLAARAPALVHCDAVQAFGKIPVRPSALGADMVTVSGHKIHAQKGIGALYIRSSAKITPLLYGGQQQNKIRPGTEPMPAIAGFTAAVSALPDEISELKLITSLRAYLVDGLSAIQDIVINSPPDALPYVTNISVLGINSEPMLNFLSDRGICVSAGSACSKGKKSTVLAAMGLPDARVSSALRISFSRFTRIAEVDMLLEGIAAGRRTIRSSRKV